MNFLMGLLQGAVWAAPVWVIYALIPDDLWLKTPENVQKYRGKAVLWLISVIFMGAFFTSFNAYGPRFELTSSELPAAPEPVQIERADEQLVDTGKNRIGQFDDQLNN